MLNSEKYQTEISQVLHLDKEFGFVNGKVEACRKAICPNCLFNGDCKNKRREWFWSEEELDLKALLHQFQEIKNQCEMIILSCEDAIKMLEVKND